MDQHGAEAERETNSVCHRRTATLSHQDRQAGDALGELQSRWLRGNHRPLPLGHIARTHGSNLSRLVGGDSGHGMLFKTFEGQWMLVLHHPFGKPTTRARLYEMEDTGDTFRVVRAARIWMEERPTSDRQGRSKT